MIPTDDEIDEFIRERFNENFEHLRYSSGHSLAPDVKGTALNQVLLYWRKLGSIALSITDTEVKLNLPGQHTPQGNEYGIEGVVDIVKEEGRTIMYDIKTQDREGVVAYQEEYERQLNLYAYIWQNLRGEALDETAIIATQFPDEVKSAWETPGSQEQLEEALLRWEPVIPIIYDPRHIEEMVEIFGKTVDLIESGCFTSPSIERLDRHDRDKQAFASRVCRNCDARFSCDSFREFAIRGGSRDQAAFRRYYEDFGEEETLESWRNATLDTGQ